MAMRVLVPLTRLQWSETVKHSHDLAAATPADFAELRDSWTPPRELLAGTESHPNLEIDREAGMYRRSRLRDSLTFLTWLMIRWPEEEEA